MYRTLGGESAATCAAHPSFPAAGECVRCRAHTCAHCHEFAALESLCGTCARSERVDAARARARVLRLVASTLGVATLVLLTFVLKWRVDPHGWGRHRKTIDALVSVLQERPCSASDVRWLVWELRAAGDDRHAASYLDEVIAVCHKLPSDVHKLAYEVHMSTGDLDGAVRDSSRRILVDPADRVAYLDRAQAYDRLGAPVNALLDEQNAYLLGADDDTLLRSICRRYRLLGEPQVASEIESWARQHRALIADASKRGAWARWGCSSGECNLPANAILALGR